MKDRDPVGRSENSKLLRHAGKSFQRLLRFVSILAIARVVMQSQQRNRRHGISRRRGRILQRLAASGEHAQTLALGSRFGVEKPSRNRIEETRDHRIGDSPREFEVAEVGSRLIGIEAGNRGRGIIVEQTGNLTMPGLRIGVSNHMQQSCGSGRLARFI